MRRSSWCAAALALVGAEPAAAANFPCNPGQVGWLSVDAGGGLWVGLNYGILNICSLSNLWEGITPQACQSWYSTLLTARTTNRPVTLYFNTDNPLNSGLPVDSNCSPTAFGNWNSHPSYHLQIN